LPRADRQDGDNLVHVVSDGGRWNHHAVNARNNAGERDHRQKSGKRNRTRRDAEIVTQRATDRSGR